jgi:hypothetical protein
VRLDGAVRDRKPEPASALPPGVERIEDPRQVFRRDSRTVVGNPDADRVPKRDFGGNEIRTQGVRHDPDRDRLLLIADLNGVQDEVEQASVK